MSAKLANRFDNTSIEMLQSLVQQLHEEQHNVIAELKDRLLAQCAIEVDAVYRIAEPGKYSMRLMKVVGVNAQWDSFYPHKGVCLRVDGRLNLARSTAGDGWGLRVVRVSPSRLVKVVWP